MRTFSRDVKSSYYKYQSLPRNFTQEKRLQELHTLKDNQVKVGIYKYSTDDDLGKGFSSKVYKGVEIQKTHKRYAIKVIQLKKFRGSNLQMLEAEIQIHKGLVHDNVVRLYEVIKTPYYYYIIMEYCPHGNLHEYIKQKKKLSESNALDIMSQVLSGGRYLMEQGVIHRDIKPANILRIGNKWKISDFGFSVKSKYGFKDRINVGTPLYMSPQSLKKSYYSAKTDIFALGIVLYEMIEGKTPWQSRNQKELIEKMKNELVLPDHLKHPKMREFITRACQLNQNQRMNRQEFLQFRLSQFDPTLSSEKDSILGESTSRAAASHSKRHSLLSEWLEKEISHFTPSLQFLSRELTLCKHIFSCIRNVDSVLIENTVKDRLVLVLFKLLLKVMRLVSDKKTNHFKLAFWEEMTSSKAYKELYQQIADYSQMYEKEYLEQIKSNDIKDIRAVNKQFPDLCHHNSLPERFYHQLLAYFTPIIRNHNHQVMLLLLKQISTQKELQKSTNGEKDQVQEQKASQSKSEGKWSKEMFPPSSQVEISPLLTEPKKQSRLLVKKMSKQDSKGVETKTSQHKQELKGSQIKEPLKLSGTKESISKPRQSKEAEKAEQEDKVSLKQEKQETLNDKFQALESLYTIYRMAELRSVREDQREITIEKIKVVDNFAESKMEKRDYLDLRRLLRSL